MLLFLLAIGLFTLFIMLGLMINEAVQMGLGHASYKEEVYKINKIQEINKEKV